jgi:hypothetical protein
MPPRQHSLASLIADIVAQMAYLFQTELRLARAEISENIGRAANSGVMIGAGAVLVLPGLVVLLLALVRWLAIAGLPEEWGLLLVGAAIVAIGFGLILSGSGGLKPSALMPQRTIEQVRADFSIAKEQGK